MFYVGYLVVSFWKYMETEVDWEMHQNFTQTNLPLLEKWCPRFAQTEPQIQLHIDVQAIVHTGVMMDAYCMMLVFMFYHLTGDTLLHWAQQKDDKWKNITTTR